MISANIIIADGGARFWAADDSKKDTFSLHHSFFDRPGDQVKLMETSKKYVYVSKNAMFNSIKWLAPNVNCIW